MNPDANTMPASLPDMHRLPPGQIRVSPSLLASDFAHFADGALACAHAGADWLHFDVMDGHFVPNLTFGAELVRALRPLLPNTTFDVHLMVEKPYDYIEQFAAAGADVITVHAEATPHLQRTLAAIRALGRRAGVALNPATSPDVLSYLWDDIDMVLVMTVNPGFGGQKFLPAAGDKVGDLAQLRDREGASVLNQRGRRRGCPYRARLGARRGRRSGRRFVRVSCAQGGPGSGISALRAAAMEP